MIQRKDIRKLTDARRYERGAYLYEAERILDYTTEEVGRFEYINAWVDGSSYQDYEVNISIDMELDTIEDCDCNCPDFEQHTGVCKHCVAVLLQYINEQEERKKQLDRLGRKNSFQRAGIQKGIGQETTPIMKELLHKQVLQRTLPILQGETYGKVRIEPYVSCSYEGATVEFKIGVSKMYVLKDVFSLVEGIENNEEISYGKQLTFIHNKDAFEEGSKPVVTFLENWVRTHRHEYMTVRYYSYYYKEKPAKLRELPLNTGDLEELFLALEGREFIADVDYSGESKWTITRENLERHLTIRGLAQGVELQMKKEFGYLGNKFYIYFVDHKVHLIGKKTLAPVKEFLSGMAEVPNETVYIGKEDVPAFSRELLPVFKKVFQCDIENFEEQEYGVEKAEFKIYLDAPGNQLITCKGISSYGDREYSVYNKTQDIEKRDLLSEVEVAKVISTYCTAYEEKLEMMTLEEKKEEKVYDLLTEGIPKLQELGEVYISESLKRIRVLPSQKVSAGVSLSGDLLRLSLVAGDMSREQLAEILTKYDRKKKFYRLKSGEFINIEGDGLDALYELKQGLMLTEKQLLEETLELPKYRALYLDAQFKENTLITVEKDKSFKSLVRNMKTVEDNDFELPASLKNVLREYQKTGYLWMRTLQYNGFCGILADDMGLGKTLQVIAFLLAQKQESVEGMLTRSLVVAPASLVYNWKSELEKFAPELSVKMVVGSITERQEMIAHASESDIMLTSYDLLKRDIDVYKKTKFACEIIDEAQYIKNHNTLAAKAVKEVKAGFKLALTGTPLENRLSELWSIFDYLMPGFLYTYKKFREELESPIVNEQDEDALNRLQKMIAPFVLRRLKKEVLSDLPDKLEKNMYAKLDGEQQELYNAHVKKMQMLLDKKTDEEFRTSKIQILAELTHLRQVCCDPTLLYENYKGASAKTDMCVQLIQNAIDNGHKILVFSQFTTMLARLEERMRAENISFYTLTGATPKEKRAQMVENFNKDDTSVFCISLKAGGTGLNLTSADIVIHYDPWWNLAVQNQATDRAHRIGQENIVTVYKLIAKGTIEENIVKLQERKRELAEKVLNGEAIQTVNFSREELMELLQ